MTSRPVPCRLHPVAYSTPQRNGGIQKKIARSTRGRILNLAGLANQPMCGVERGSISPRDRLVTLSGTGWKWLVRLGVPSRPVDVTFGKLGRCAPFCHL